MFSKSRINEPGPKAGETDQKAEGDRPLSLKPSMPSSSGQSSSPASPSKAKPPASTLSSDLTVVGNMKSTGDILVEGTIEGDIRAHQLTIGESATVRGEVVADDVVVNGRIVGRLRGLKVRLTSTARVEGDIIHKTIAIESGAHFEGSVQRQDDPLNNSGGQKPAQAAPTHAPGPAPQTARSEG
ncbi:bactofilin family protein [Maritimibacter dapengensis]|uniref:Polymer-forming cytoskeletal protein n=1 Tax=Maritimibacter dapengensis TaxID=2836868 RepID=A0ABS6T2G9_9RHOB|nr:polymer-forming cytoskeletal protein [Maritimibacter dapengensis]MBV7379433.1 polymer-forming cytoskeletal protein [Maritimibacter dapengensis]